MICQIKNESITSGESTIDYVSFGKGNKALIIIPGLSLKDVKGAALPLACMYRIFAKDYRVYVIDRKRTIPDGYTVREMADDIAFAMKELHISHADVLGISQGGMIAQYLAINHPALVHKLILGVTASRQNDTIAKVVGTWIEMAEKNDYESLITDMMPKMYSDSYLKRYQWLFPLLKKIGKPKNPHRFLILAKACFTCHAYDELDKIQCPVLVLGGREDKVVTGQASEEIAEKLHCDIYMYNHLGHAAYEEAGDFNSRVYQFLNS